MLEPRNYDGVLVFLMGMILVVFVGFLLSFVVDRSSLTAKTEKELAFEIERQSAEIIWNQALLDSRKLQLEEAEKGTVGQHERFAELNAGIASMLERKDQSTRLVLGFEEEIQREEAAYQEYQSRFIKWVRATATGTLIGTLETQGGRVYQDARIASVEEDGMRIHHADGVAFIQGNDLPDSYREQFQWGVARPPAVVPQSTAPPAIPIAAPAPPERPPARPRDTSASDPSALKEMRIAAARQALQRAGENIVRLSADYRTATHMASRSPSRSIPGSLETWSDRKSRLSSELTKAKGDFSKTRADLIILSPNDPLLEVWHLP